jgi:hypothetical protein
VGEEGILLCLVEAVDLVEEQDGPLLVQREPVLGRGDRRADVGDAAHDRGQRGELRPDLRGQKARE